MYLLKMTFKFANNKFITYCCEIFYFITIYVFQCQKKNVYFYW